MALDIGIVKTHLRIDGDDEDAILAVYLATAIETVEAATGIVEAEDVPERWKICVLLLVASMYTNREASSERALKAVPYGYENMILNLRVSGV